MKILVAHDGSQYSESALVSLRLAGLPSDTEVHVLSVLDDQSIRCGSATGGAETGGQRQPDSGEDYETQLAIARRGADLIRSLFPSWAVTAEVRVGSPALEIIKCAEGDDGQAGARPFDLVVVGSRGLGGLKRLLLGSVAHRIVTTLRGSVRVSRGRQDRLNFPPESDETSAPRLIVGVDGSPDAHAAVEVIASRSWPVGTRVVVASFETGPLTFVSQQVDNTIWGGAPLSSDSPAVSGRPALRVVSEAADFLRLQRPELLVTTLVNPAHPQYGLLEAVETCDKNGADCIFVGATGHRGIVRFLLGSVSTTVAMNANCSVEIVRRGT